MNSPSELVMPEHVSIVVVALAQSSRSCGIKVRPVS